MCRGCLVPNNADPVDLQSAADGFTYIAVDWNTATYVNEYQPGSEQVGFIVRHWSLGVKSWIYLGF